MRDLFDGLFGNELLKDYLCERIEAGKLPHALIFEGERGSGKYTVSKMTAMALAPEFAWKIIKDASPDVTVHGLEDGKKSIGVSLIRTIRYQSYIKPQELDVRVFIIKDAQEMTTEAQNALLKILEEPPAGVYFFLLCDNVLEILPTVRSRAPILRMQVFSHSEIDEYLSSHSELHIGKSRKLASERPQDYEKLLRASNGVLGRALELVDFGGQNKNNIENEVISLLEFLSKSAKSDILVYFLSNIKEREQLEETLVLLQVAVRDMLAVKYGIDFKPNFFAGVQEAECFALEFAKSSLIGIYDSSDVILKDLRYNVNLTSELVKAVNIITDYI